MRSLIAWPIFVLLAMPAAVVVMGPFGQSWPVRLAGLAVWAVVYVMAGRFVSLTWSQAMFGSAWQVAWRLAYLPFRDWPPRADEASTWLQLRHPTEPGALLYVKQGGLRQPPLDTTGRNAG
jgi:hypothetical protein